MMFPVSTILEKQLSKGGGLSPMKGVSSRNVGAQSSSIRPPPCPLLTAQRCSPARQNVMRIGLVAVAAVVTVLIPDFSNVMAFIGSTCCNLLALICPPALHLFYFKRCVGPRLFALTLTH